MSNLIMTRGDDETFNMALTRSGVAVDLTNSTIKFTVKASLETGTPVLFQKTELDGITVLSAAGGTLYVVIDEADTENIEINNSGRKVLYWDIEVVLSNGEKKTVDKGLLILEADVG